MLNPVNPQDPEAVGRLLEFLSPNPPWYRSLWSIGLILGLSELHEACAALRGGMLSEAAVRKICSALVRKAGKDPTLTDQEKAYLRTQIKDVPKADGPAHHAVAEMAAFLEKDYIKRWERVVSGDAFTIEHFARSIASHLLDVGFSAPHLHVFIKDRMNASQRVSLAELCEELHGEISKSPHRQFQVLLAFSKPPKIAAGTPKEWLQGKAVIEWLIANRFDKTDIRAPVAILLNVEARDAAGAAQAAREELDRYAARTLIATGEPLMSLPWLWVKGEKAPVPQSSASRGVRVTELYRENLIFSPATSKSIDAAFEMLAHLDESSPPAAIAGGWGAIEGLLADPGDRAMAAENLAALVTCSFPRAELTALSFRAEKEHASIAEYLKPCGSNRERSRVLAQLILDNKLPSMHATAERAAVLRVKKVLNNPSPELLTVKEAIAEAFHRLYRQRNMILHGGRLDSVTLTASLRTVAKLTGAGMDRITHGHYVQSLGPLELVARADMSIALINKQNAISCVDLLEPN